MGFTTAGIGVQVVRVSGHYARLMRRYEDGIKENIDELAEKIKNEGVEMNERFSLILKIEQKSVLAYEEYHNVTVYLGEMQ